MGGYPGKLACNAAVQSADYVALRDSDPMVPDSAVMVKELYGDVISSTVDEVINSIFPEGAENKKYIAVQFTKNYDACPIATLVDTKEETVFAIPKSAV
jgi:hypothetical protein